MVYLPTFTIKNYLNVGKFIGKYTSPMDPMGCNISGVQVLTKIVALGCHLGERIRNLPGSKIIVS